MYKYIHAYGSILVLLLGIACTNNSAKVSAADAHSHAHGDGVAHSHADEVTDYFGAYTIADKKYGTQTVVTVANGKRTMVTNALPNHQTGNFPNPGNPNTISAQKNTYEIPLEPKWTGEARWAREPGIAINGIKFEPQTAERINCETGERFSVEAVNDLIDMGLDFNHAHVQPTGTYHYHGTPTGLVDGLQSEDDLVHIGFAHDGYPFYYSKSGKYKPSFTLASELRKGEECAYDRPNIHLDVPIQDTKPTGDFVSDWVYVEGLGQLDECNGIEVEGQYMYIVTDVYPYVGRCLNGEFKEQRGPGGPGGPRGGGPQGGPPRDGNGPPPGGRPPRNG